MTLLLTFGFMLLLMTAMAIGVIFGRRPITGSCGGIGALGMDAECDFCGGNPAKCESRVAAEAAVEREAAPLAYDAARAKSDA